VTLLGSGGGPRVDVRRYGISILVEAAGQKLLFDCGRGATLRAVEAGIRPIDLDKVFLTHLHSDHIISIPDLLLTLWAEEVGTGVATLIQQGISPEQAANIVAHHTSPEETGIVFNRVKPRLAIYAHGGNAQTVTEARKNYTGPLEVGEDLMVIRIGEKIDVQRPRP
jgi:ribonuclease BN (tRNA processing enzyme)